jgi:hypothetical protein
MRRLACMASLLFLGCGGMPFLESKEEATFVFDDWKERESLNDAPLLSKSHKAYVDIYANALGKEAYIKHASEFPVGAEIFKPLYPDDKRSKIVRLTIMVKMPKGYDTKNGDWWYGVYNGEGTQMWHQGRIQSCIDCHELAKQTDYLFTQSVMQDITFANEMRELMH